MAKVYVKTDSNSVITEINSELFLESIKEYVLIGEGVGDKYAHAQGNYLEHGLMDDSGRYKLLDGNVVELTEAEKEELFPAPKPEPFDTEILGQMATDAEIERMELGQRMTDYELIVLEGGVLNV
mgnify:FL=1